jgi:outer membrane protein TolC
MEGENQKILVTADEAYWQIVSISNKLKLTEKYVELLRKLDSDVDKMREQGVATTSDKLSVSLKLNEAEMTLLKAQNGLILSKMLLCQLCGLDLHSDIVLKDELNEDLVLQPDTVIYDPENLEENRSELKSLTLATHMYNQKVNIVRSDFLPTIAVMGNYMITNPSLNNGLSNKAGDMWNIGVVTKIPLFHFGEGMNKVRKAKSDALISQYQLDDAKGKVSLQVEQYERQISEANSRLAMSTVLMENAEENLRMAKLGFQEGVTSSSDVLAAHTAWLQAHSEEIDAKIERIMANVYLRQATGQLNNN